VKNIFFLFVIVILGILQVTLLDYFRVFGIRPDLLLICVVVASLVFEFKWAFILSIFAGIFKDACGVSTFGINTLLFPIWCLLIARLNREITLDNNLIHMGLVFIVTILHNIVSGMISVYSGNVIPLGIFLRIVIIESIYTALVLPLIFKIVYLLQRIPPVSFQRKQEE
jgi:rod shape-determining protein MreD